MMLAVFHPQFFFVKRRLDDDEMRHHVARRLSLLGHVVSEFVRSAH